MIIKADPAREEVYENLMLIYSNPWMRAEALKVCEECNRALKNQVGVEPCRLAVFIYKKILENQ